MEAVTFKKLVKGHAYSVTGFNNVSLASNGRRDQVLEGSDRWIRWFSNLWTLTGGLSWPPGTGHSHKEPMGSGGVDWSLE